MTRALRVLTLAVVPLLAALGCTGSISNGDDGTGPPGGGPGQPGGGPGQPGGGPAQPPGPGAISDNAAVPGAAPVRRLTRYEFDNTVRDLLGVDGLSKVAQLSDTESSSAGFLKGGAITGGDDAHNLLTAAGGLSDGLVTKLGSFLPCNPVPTDTAGQDSCVAKFIVTFGKRAYRRPLTDREVQLAKDLYAAQRGPEVGAPFEKAVASLIGAFIQAPQFLYHWEIGSAAPLRDGNLIRYNPYEIASRLSYFFWATMPDDKLFAAADAGALSTPDQIAEQARRLLVDDRAKQGLTDFHMQWLEVGDLVQTPKDDDVKNFNPMIAQSMLNETRDFVSSLFQGPKASGKLETLLTSTSSTIDANLAPIYGANAGAVNLDPTQRAGIFTQAAFLAIHSDTGDSNPVKRGDAVLRRLLCQEFKMPDMVPPVADSMPGGSTTRDRFAMHAMMPCATCHQIIDPIGFAFESYDTVGAWRTTDQGKPVDSTGSVILPGGSQTFKFKGASELINQLATLPEVRDCMTTQWMRYMLGRREGDGDGPSLKAVRDLFEKGGHDFRELLVDLTRTRTFTHRSPSAGEVLQ
jgi:hypothetical protein